MRARLRHNSGMDTNLKAVLAALAELSDIELRALIDATNNKPHRSGARVGAESVTACGARNRVRQGQDQAGQGWQALARH
jgi:hypothetical protein